MKRYFLIFIICFFFFLLPGCLTKTEAIKINAGENQFIPGNAEKNVNPVIDNSQCNAENKLDVIIELPENSREKESVINNSHPEISTELYEKTFNEIDIVIKKLNLLIQMKDYSEWSKYLTNEYIKIKSNPDYLKEISLSPALKSKNITLFDLKDYFFYVIVPSNTNTLLEKISFIDNNHVKAYGSIFNQSGVLYYLEKIDEQWKIGILN